MNRQKDAEGHSKGKEDDGQQGSHHAHRWSRFGRFCRFLGKHGQISK
jgi:hypothetical protein